MLKYLGLVTIVAAYVLIISLVRKWRDHELFTVSRHAASNKHASLVFAAVLIGFGVILYYWYLAWFKSALGLGGWFVILISTITLFQILTAAAPDIPGWLRTVHRIAAHSMAFLLMPLALLILLTGDISGVARIIGWISFAFMVVAYASVAILGKAKQKYFIYQISYVMACHVLILSAAYL